MRNLLFYPKLAVAGMRRNKILYVPYLLAASLMVMLFYILASMSEIVGRSDILGGAQIGLMLSLSTVVCGLLTVLVLYYLSSFVMKQRTQEFGLYTVLGMEKGNLCLLVFWEILFSYLGSLFCGIAAGALFSQLVYLLLLNIVHLPVNFEIVISLPSIRSTAILFGLSWVLSLLAEVNSLYREDPLAILRAAAEGEREPRSKKGLAFTGVITLAAGYALAATVQNPGMVLLIFFPAVILVIIATYCIFSATSIVMLKALRHNKRFYYKPENFITVSGMLYRMKQNAIGLANICILASAVLVTISSCVCLYVGGEDSLKSIYPQELRVRAYFTADQDIDPAAAIAQALEEAATPYQITIENPDSFTDRSTTVQWDGLTIEDNSSTTGNLVLDYRLIDELNTAIGTDYRLQPGEIAVSGLFDSGDTITISGNRFYVKERLAPLPDNYLTSTSTTNNVPMIFFSSLEDLRLASSGDPEAMITCSLNFDYDLNHTNATAFRENLWDSLSSKLPHLMSIYSRSEARVNFYSIYGSLLFVGLFFVALFLLATVLIIYYKQITEGYQDRRRFLILQQVGMSDAEVRATVRRQVLMVFFLPIGMALLHIAFAFPALQKIMTAFGMYNVRLFVVCVIISALVFILFYTGVYLFTARTYYRIVRASPQ